MSLLAPADARRIEQAIAEVERSTAGEIVVMTVTESDRYDGPRALVTGLWTAVAATTALLWGPWTLAPIWVCIAQLPLAAGIWWLLGAAPLRRLLVPPSRAAEAVHARALRAFVERGVHETRDRSGLLIFISELEHRVEILADRGIHARVGTEGWSAHVARVVGAIREGRAADGIVQVIESIGALLAREFPRRSDDTNELPDELIRSS